MIWLSSRWFKIKQVHCTYIVHQPHVSDITLSPCIERQITVSSILSQYLASLCCYSPFSSPYIFSMPSSPETKMDKRSEELDLDVRVHNAKCVALGLGGIGNCIHSVVCYSCASWLSSSLWCWAWWIRRASGPATHELNRWHVTCGEFSIIALASSTNSMASPRCMNISTCSCRVHGLCSTDGAYWTCCKLIICMALHIFSVYLEFSDMVLWGDPNKLCHWIIRSVNSFIYQGLSTKWSLYIV